MEYPRMKQPGQNLGEYGIVLGLVAIVCIFTVGMLGTNVSSLLTGSIRHQSATGIAETAGGWGHNMKGPHDPSSLTGAEGGIPFASLPGKILEVTLENGRKFRINMADPVAVAETAGPLGGTENALAAFIQMIDQLEQQGEDPAVIAELRELALRGQDIKETMQILKNAIGNRTFRNTDEYMSFIGTTQIVDIHGKATTPSAIFGEMHLYSNFTNSSSDSLGYMVTTAAPQGDDPTSAFIKKLADVNKLDYVKNSPTMRSLLNELFGLQIYEASKTAYETMWSESGVTDFPQGLDVYKDTVRVNANNICVLSNSESCMDRNG
jgi:hypothetical protein